VKLYKEAEALAIKSEVIISITLEWTHSALVLPQVNARISEDSKSITELCMTRCTNISTKNTNCSNMSVFRKKICRHNLSIKVSWVTK
jgi:hypothetical protein